MFCAVHRLYFRAFLLPVTQARNYFDLYFLLSRFLSLLVAFVIFLKATESL